MAPGRTIAGMEAEGGGAMSQGCAAARLALDRASPSAPPMQE